MKRILFITTSFENGAIPNILLDLASYWVADGWECLFLALEPLPEDHASVRRCRQLGYSLSSLNVGPKSVFRALYRLRKKIRELQPDLISTHLGRADIYTPWVKGSIPQITTHHNVKQNHGRLTNLGYRLSDHKVAWRTGVSQACNDSFLLGDFLKTPHSVIYNPVDPARMVSNTPRATLLKAWDWEPTVQLLIAVARLAPAKGYPDLLEAFSRLRAAGHQQLRLVIAGEGPLRPDLEGLIVEKGLQTSVRLLGLYQNVADLYTAADGLILASQWEGFGLVILEAWLHGCPVAASSLPPIREFMVDGENGVLFQPGDPDSIAQGVLRLLEDPQRSREWAQRGRTQVLTRFAPMTIANQYADLFRQVLGLTAKP